MLNTTVQKFGSVKLFENIRERSLLCSPWLHLFDQNTVKSNTVQYKYSKKQ